MKKIGLVTWKGHGNYGTNLQSFALIQFLRIKGYDVTLLERTEYPITIKAYIKYILHLFGYYYLKDKISTKTSKEIKTDKFHKEYYEVKCLYTNRHFRKIQEDIDIFISGSDQIWNTYYKFDPFMFLAFVRRKKKISYASSLGTSSIPDEHKDTIRRYLLEYEYIGVREETGRNLLNNLLQTQEVKQVMDPTFLLSAREWEKFASKAVHERNVPEKYLLCYFIGEKKYDEEIKDIKKEYSIDNVVVVSPLKNHSFTYNGALEFLDSGPLEFVDLINKASLVCTDSFHATALSINFQKNFIEFMRFTSGDLHSQNSRILNILERYNLQKRIYSKDNKEWAHNTDYSCVNKKVSEDINKSKEFLLKSIEN